MKPFLIDGILGYATQQNRHFGAQFLDAFFAINGPLPLFHATMGQSNIILHVLPCWYFSAGAAHDLQHGLAQGTDIKVPPTCPVSCSFWLDNAVDIVKGGPAGMLLAGDTQWLSSEPRGMLHC